MREAFGESFDVPAGYLNTASIGVPPATVADAVAGAVREWRSGASRAPQYDRHVAAARRNWARLAGVEPGRVAAGASVSQLVGLVAASVPDRTRVLVAGDEFTSVTFPFAAQRQRGVTVTEAPLRRLADALGDADLVAVSVVQAADGAQADLTALRQSGKPVLLDVTQALGWLPLDVGWADYVVGTGYKWLTAPRGAAWLAVHPESPMPVPHAANWYAAENPWDTVYGLPLRLAAGPPGLDLSPAWFAQVGAAAATEWFAGVDLALVRDHCVGLADRLRAELGLPPAGSAITTLDLTPAQTERLAAAGVAGSVRAGRTRLAWHLYNTEDDLDLVLSALASTR